ncbi:alpha-1,4-glucan--maltose-1-phosphate maltosyltransferase [Allocoleopsis franciscana]|uniref:Alpha-1,4-glucan:maltose-1-phosphate maltosyltransferase n=1 Tax=Allocoleopsis franciscana PCC 7113 TaxID=1173027 RepID=K9WI20_9CYAN|nr:alpha-1,4-glucan--maltose-1-phosphate maltosyltransferase [Allocoleopsis franciscana]AFZ19456.1 glycosidase [Allocoleopsis franciscana PCC 7113]
MLPKEGRQRVQIEGVSPEIDGGRFPIKRTIGEKIQVEADMFCDGHDMITGVILYRPETSQQWQEAPLSPLFNDRWQGEFSVSEIGSYVYTIMAWVDHFKSWRRDILKKIDAVQVAPVDWLIGAQLIEETSQRASGDDAEQLQTWSNALRSHANANNGILEDKIVSPHLAFLMDKYPDRTLASTYEKLLKVTVDREKARFSTWYELFPRSCGAPGEHGTFADCINRLPYIADLGFDVLYLPPIHPIGVTFRKGKNNTVVAEPGDVGVPWGIGAPEGGHKAIHTPLGTLEDFRKLVSKAAEYGIEIALDLAYQCSPDHPYARENPQWFKRRPDGTIQHAENPPKKYQDIYPIDFETEDWQNLWEELKSIVLFWIDQGVKIFRVDNPHTKAFPFWEWMIGEVKQAYPDVLFLAEAFTRPKVMSRLAKMGFSQSYTYFTWRNNKWELTEYMKELTQSEVREFFRPNFWPNTPDILHAFLQHGGRPAFILRLVLAGTLTANYGIYGPAFDVCENRPIREGSEEYLDSEKYQIREWDLNSPYTIKDYIARVNRSRREHPALQSNNSIRFHHIDNEEIICYTKQTEDLKDVMLMVVNLNPYHTQSGWIHLPLESLGIKPDQPYQVHDLLNNAQYTWEGGSNYVELNPHITPAHLFWIQQ